VQRGDLFRVTQPGSLDPRPSRVFVIVSRDRFIESRYSSVVCVPVYSARSGNQTELLLDESDGLKRPSAARCDELTSVARSRLTQQVGSLSAAKLRELRESAE
jgi:mRNA interferase MazF